MIVFDASTEYGFHVTCMIQVEIHRFDDLELRVAISRIGKQISLYEWDPDIKMSWKIKGKIDSWNRDCSFVGSGICGCSSFYVLKKRQEIETSTRVQLIPKKKRIKTVLCSAMLSPNEMKWTKGQVCFSVIKLSEWNKKWSKSPSIDVDSWMQLAIDI